MQKNTSNNYIMSEDTLPKGELYLGLLQEQEIQINRSDLPSSICRPLCSADPFCNLF